MAPETTRGPVAARASAITWAERARWALPILSGARAVLLLTALTGRSGAPALVLQGLACAIDLALCAGILVMLLLADGARRPTAASTSGGTSR